MLTGPPQTIQHARRLSRDLSPPDDWLCDPGIRVVSVPAVDVLGNVDAVVTMLVAAAADGPLHRASARSPSPAGGGTERI